jgi:Arc/MetJ family transcription regulator
MLNLPHTVGANDMRTRVIIEDELLAKAAKLAGNLDRSAVVRKGLEALIKRKSVRGLARLGGTQLALKVAPRQRTATAT